jgi:hypothetical protein
VSLTGDAGRLRYWHSRVELSAFQGGPVDTLAIRHCGVTMCGNEKAVT